MSVNKKVIKVEDLRVYFHTKKVIQKQLMETTLQCMKTKHLRS